ncbi:MAG TPA: shikimate dehydrogenase [Terracidiphilus sp.]|nr:shikimate dehydrogenase [Terracidiphilus sp.]
MRQLTMMPILAPTPAEPAAAPQTGLPRLRLPRLCVAVRGATPAELMACAEGVLKDARFLEFRLDLLAKPTAGIGPLKDFLQKHRDVQAIATCRRKPNGGNFVGSLTSEFEVLLKAAEAGCQIVDLEVESAEQAGKAQLARFRAALKAVSTALLVSYHDFSRTKGLDEAAARIRAFEPDYVKVVSTARTLADNLAVLRMIEDQSLNAQVVGIAMGEEGLVSRVLAPREGAAFTFASAGEGAETAPGQASLRTLIDLYRVERLDQATRIFGVAGNPISHSLSPRMHTTAFKRENVNAIMLPLKVKALADLLTLTRELPLAGVAVTMPLKEEVLPHLANMDPLTARIGACNTLRTGADGKLYGFNTDVAGVIRPLEKRMKIKDSRILVVGAGGAARAAVFGLVDQGAEVFVTNRTHETAVALARKAHAKSLKLDLLAKHRFDAIINSTPCGMAGVKQTMAIKENELNASLVFDMVYNPPETPLLKLAQSRGLAVISGVDMFVQQGARQFEIWTGKPAPEIEMLRVVELALRKRV